MVLSTLETTVGQLVTQRPNRARIFESFGIDYCCGGKKPLQQACREKGVDPQTVANLLLAFDEQAPASPEADWSAASLTELADHIEQTHHAYLKRELPRLENLVERVNRAHGDHRPELSNLLDIFRKFSQELKWHMAKEEQVLFPLCRQLDAAKGPQAFHCGSIRNPVQAMVAEHDNAGYDLGLMRDLTDGYTVPPEACNTYRAMLAGLAELELDMHRHVHKENSILFPKAVEAEARLKKLC